MSKQTIAVDIDDVLAANASGMIAFSNQQWGTKLTIDDFSEHWGEMWKMADDLEATEKRAEEFFASDPFSSFRHFPEALAVLKKLQQRYRLILVTSRRKRFLRETTEWIDRFFPGIFEETHYAGIWDNPKEGRHEATKGDICKSLNVDYLIDDQLKHCLAVANCNITALLFGTYEWNRAESLPENVVRVKDWKAIGEFFDASR